MKVEKQHCELIYPYMVINTTCDHKQLYCDKAQEAKTAG